MVAALMWLGLVALVVCVLLALLAEWGDGRAPRSGARPVPATERVRRNATALGVSAALLALVYWLFAGPLVTDPGAPCAARGSWSSYPPETLDARVFPPSATCRFRSGETDALVPGWATVLITGLAAPVAVSGVGFALAVRRRGAQERGRRGAGGVAA
ncbi:hypothetical protein ABT160_27895 [Streptomyces sp. NPDC001941]|uniref:hypothetical protein n=1 Tax=Streptomyces sp. NPDC001941 TaxID=3154659 RepID=UPI0033191194